MLRKKSVAGNLNSIKKIGPKYGYFPKLTKSYLVVKEKNDGSTELIC